MDRKFGKVYIDYIYDYIIEKMTDEIQIEEKDNNLIKELLEKEIFTRCFKALLYCINAERVERKLKGDTPEERYEYFCSAKSCIAAMEENFPLMKEQMFEEMQGKVSFVHKVLNHFQQEEECICQKFFNTKEEEIIGLEQAGDWHNDKCVMILTFQSGNKIVCKPTKGRNVEFLKGILTFFFEDSYLELYDSLPMEIGAWVKYVEHVEVSEKAECEQFYYNYGKLLFVSYLLGMNDMHYENLIAHKVYPVITDVETVFSSYLFFDTHRFEYDAQYKAVKKLLYGVMATGLVPIFSMTEYFGGDVSCLSNKGIRLVVEKVKNEYRDDMYIYTETELLRQYQHLPNKETEPLLYGEQILLGFEDAFADYQRQKVTIKQYLIANYGKVEARIILNMTKGYSKILRMKSDPRYRFKPELFKELLKKLKRSNEFNEKVYMHEVAELCTGNIPAFYWNASENRVYGYHQDSVIRVMELKAFNGEVIAGIMKEQTDEKVIHEQEKLIENSIKSSIVLGIHYQAEEYEDHVLSGSQKEDICLRKNIDENCICGEDGTISWIGLMVNDKEQLEYAVLDWSLYSGVTGIGYLYLSEYFISKDKQAADIIKRIYTTLVKAYELGVFNEYNISYYCGLTGIYAFLKKVKKSGMIEEKTVEMQLEKIKELIRQNIKNTNCYDTLSGIHSACIYYFADAERDGFGREMLNSISEYFLQCFQTQVMEREFDYASFAHGYSGVMTSVMCMNVINHKEEYMKVVRCLYEKERELYYGEFQWNDNRSQGKTHSHFWCHGSCGIMQSRLLWRKYGLLKDGILEISEAALDEEMEYYKKRIESGAYNSHNNSLCHGNFALIDFLISYEKVTGKTVDKEYCDRTIAMAAKQGYSCVGAPGAINAIGCMVGEAGIQYTLNRYQKQEIESLLVMEAL